MIPYELTNLDLEAIPEGLKLYRCATYDVGGLRVDDGPYATEDLSPQEVADKLGAAEATRPPFPATILVWDPYLAVKPALWLDREQADSAAGRWDANR